MSRPYHHWKPCEVALLYLNSDAENASILGLPFYAVKSKRHALGIAHRPEKPRRRPPAERNVKMLELLERIETLRRYA